MTAASMADGPASGIDSVSTPDSDWAELGPPIPPGTLLADRYSMESVLAEGGMGVVWLGRHVELDKPVAIKFLRRALCGKDAVVARFLNEARAAAALRSNHVVRVHDVGQLETGRPYLVMEHLEGIDLDALVEREGALADDRAVEYVLQVCEALTEAHAAGIVHRDIKPENLFLAHVGAPKPIVKVVDFGLAKRLDGAAAKVITGPLENMGSPCYMSPEQIESPQEIDERTDIWSLGVVLYRLLTATLPFDGDSVTEVCARVLNATPAPIRSLRPDLDATIESIVARCLQKKPSDRYQSIGEMVQALERYRESLPSPPPPPSSVTSSSLRTIAPPKRRSNPDARTASADEPIGAIPGVRPVRVGRAILAVLFGFSVPLAFFASGSGAERAGIRPPEWTEGWLFPAKLSVTEPVPREDPGMTVPLSTVVVAGATAESERRTRAHDKKKHEWRYPVTMRSAKPAEDELSPEEIVRRKLAYEEYLQSNGYQPIKDALRQLRSDGTSGAGAAKSTSGERGSKPDVPRP